jgi:hypothetical protein
MWILEIKPMKVKIIQIVYYTYSIDCLEFRIVVRLPDFPNGRLISKAL